MTEPADFAEIIRRRLFENRDYVPAARALADRFIAAAAGTTWTTVVFDRLGRGRDLATFADRVVDTYPFHPDLFTLAAREWTVVQAFQRVRSTVKIFARTALHWSEQAAAGRWVPQLIGVGDIPLETEALGVTSLVRRARRQRPRDPGIPSRRNQRHHRLLRRGQRVCRRRPTGGYGRRDTSADTGGANGATACFAYSLVARGRGDRGATKSELSQRSSTLRLRTTA